MTENLITIYLDPIAHENIIRDQELFKIGNNKSKIFKRIIINHYSKYQSNINDLKKRIKKNVIEESDLHVFSEEVYSNIAWKITKYLCDNPIGMNNKKNKHKDKIHIRINKNDFKLNYILELCPKNSSESEYLANIIYSYLSEPQHEREKIIYRDIIDTINKAFQNNLCIGIQTKTHNNNKIQHISPKEICVSKEELYNYLLYQGYSESANKYYASTIHIHNILCVHLDLNLRTFEPDIEEQFKKMKRNGIQFSINGNIIYKVKLTEKGKFLFDSRYLERPNPLKESDESSGIYYFDCSEMQFKSYFAPFWKDIIIIEPKEMINEIVREYTDAIHNYQDDV